MARQLSAKKPKDLRYTLGTLFSYMGRHKFLLLAVAVLAAGACAAPDRTGGCAGYTAGF